MAGLDFTDENKSKSVFDMDLFRLKPGEKAVVTFLDRTATMAWAHYVRVGVSEKTGKPVGRYFRCLGYDVDAEGNVQDTILKTEGKNPEKCPACQVCEPGFDQRVGMPRRRFVVQIGRYTTNSRGDFVKPISMRIQAWVFGDDKFSKLADRAKVHGADFRRKDLMIACVSEQFQNYDIDVFPGAPEWSKTDEGKASRAACGLERNNEVERLISMKISYDELKTKTVDATPEVGRTDVVSQAGSVVDSVDSALAALDSGKLSDPDEGDLPDIVDHSNDREPVGVAAGIVDAVEADADFNKILEGL